MAYDKKEGVGAVFWVSFIVFGILVLIGIFYWMVMKPKSVPHSPEKPSGAVWTSPVPASRGVIAALTRLDIR